MNIFYHAFKRFGKRTVLGLGCKIDNCNNDEFILPFTAPNYNPETFESIKSFYKNAQSNKLVHLDDLFKQVHNNIVFKPKTLIRHEQQLENKIRNVILGQIDLIFEVIERQLLTKNQNLFKSLSILYEPFVQGLDIREGYSLPNCFNQLLLTNIQTSIESIQSIEQNAQASNSDVDALISNVSTINNCLKQSLSDINDTHSLNFTIYVLHEWMQLKIPSVANLYSNINLEICDFFDTHPYILAYKACLKGRNLYPATSFNEAQCFFVINKMFLVEEYESIDRIVSERADLVRRRMTRQKGTCENVFFGELFSFYFLDATQYINPYCNVEKITLDKIRNVILNKKVLYKETNISLGASDSAINLAWSNASQEVQKLSDNDISKYWKLI